MDDEEEEDAKYTDVSEPPASDASSSDPLSPMSDLARVLEGLTINSPVEEDGDNHLPPSKPENLEGSFTDATNPRTLNTNESFESAKSEEEEEYDSSDADSFVTAAPGIEVFLQGNKPSAADNHVLAAIADVSEEITPEQVKKRRNIYGYKKCTAAGFI